MAEVGDRVAATSKAAARSGVVTAVTGSLLRVRWDTGEETSFVPAAGALSVIAKAPTKPPKTKRGSKRDSTAAAATAQPFKKNAARPAASAKTTGKKKR